MAAEPTLPIFEILVVDDELPVSELLARIAQKQFPEAKFSSAQSVEETRDYLRMRTDCPPQLILLDINLRHANDGLSFLPELWAYFKGSVPIIMLSVFNEEAKIVQAYDQGAVAYTQKPEDLQAWHTYVLMLRQYWYQSVCLPTFDPPLN